MEKVRINKKELDRVKRTRKRVYRTIREGENI